MKLLFALVAVIASVPNISGAEVLLAEGIKKLEPEINAYLEKRAKAEDETKNAVPYVSNVVRGDINGDHKDDVFVSYAIEGIGGGNFSLLYQVLFLKGKNRFIFKAERDNGCFGTAQGKSYIPQKMVKGKVICEFLEFAPEDGVCCPSIKGKGDILLKNGKLIEGNSGVKKTLYQWLRQFIPRR